MHTDRYVAIALALAAAVLPAAGLEPQASFDRTLTVTGPVDLDVNTHSGAIAVRSGEGSTVRIRGTVRVHNGRAGGDIEQKLRDLEQNPPIRQSGNTITIDRVDDPALRNRLAISYEITTPAETKLRARSGSGAGVAEGIRGPADISTGSGSLTITNIGSEVRAHTGSGRIQLNSVKGEVDAHTGSGTIDGTGVAGPIVARTGSGAIRLEQTAAASVKAATGSGSVTVKVPGQSGFDVRAHTGSGSIQGLRDMTIRGAFSARQVEGKMRGGGPLLDLGTGSGSIRVE